MYRFSNDAQWNNESGRNEPNKRFSGRTVSISDINAIFIYDKAFEPAPTELKKFISFDNSERVFFHELVHAFDFSSSEKLSTSSRFLDAARWSRDFSFVGGVDVLVVKNQEAVSVKSFSEKRYIDFWASHVFWARKYKFPSVYSMTSPPETLAECVSWLYLDEVAETYLDRKLVEFITDEVLN